MVDEPKSPEKLKRALEQMRTAQNSLGITRDRIIAPFNAEYREIVEKLQSERHQTDAHTQRIDELLKLARAHHESTELSRAHTEANIKALEEALRPSEPVPLPVPQPPRPAPAPHKEPEPSEEEEEPAEDLWSSRYREPSEPSEEPQAPSSGPRVTIRRPASGTGGKGPRSPQRHRGGEPPVRILRGFNHQAFYELLGQTHSAGYQLTTVKPTESTIGGKSHKGYEYVFTQVDDPDRTHTVSAFEGGRRWLDAPPGSKENKIYGPNENKHWEAMVEFLRTISYHFNVQAMKYGKPFDRLEDPEHLRILYERHQVPWVEIKPKPAQPPVVSPQPTPSALPGGREWSLTEVSVLKKTRPLVQRFLDSFAADGFVLHEIAQIGTAQRPRGFRLSFASTRREGGTTSFDIFPGQEHRVPNPSGDPNKDVALDRGTLFLHLEKFREELKKRDVLPAGQTVMIRRPDFARDFYKHFEREHLTPKKPRSTP